MNEKIEAEREVKKFSQIHTVSRWYNQEISILARKLMYFLPQSSRRKYH